MLFYVCLRTLDKNILCEKSNYSHLNAYDSLNFSLIASMLWFASKCSCTFSIAMWCEFQLFLEITWNFTFPRMGWAITFFITHCTIIIADFTIFMTQLSLAFIIWAVAQFITITIFIMQVGLAFIIWLNMQFNIATRNLFYFTYTYFPLFIWFF